MIGILQYLDLGLDANNLSKGIFFDLDMVNYFVL